MSKMDAVRAMREARYAEGQARASKPAAPKAAAPKAAATKTAPKTAPKAEPAGADPAAAEELCGHRNMSGRTCTRERGHSAKSHRYS